MVQKCNQDLQIPNSLPPKMLELLHELAMVEKEITRLENQINAIKAEAKHEELRAHTQPSLQEWEVPNQRESPSPPPPPPPPDHFNTSKNANEKTKSFEMKALHFITKAIKGDYKLSDFTLNDKAINSKRFKQNQKLRRPSPSRHLEMSTPLHPEEDSIHRWPPNKLSENIMRCLIFIFLRLLRTSRAMELEKPIARSTDFSLSFRAEASSGLTFPKDSRQQDPYGIFDSKESLLRDIGPYKNLIVGAKEMMLHDLHGLKSSDPNIVFALCCATRSSPAVKIYTAEGVTAELERSKVEYLQASIVVTSSKRVALPELLLRNMFDFGGDIGALVEWLCQQLPASGSLRKSIVDCFKQLRGGKIEMMPYDFEFQYLFAV